MTFAGIEWLRPGWLLALPPLALLLWAAVRRARGADWGRLVDAHLLPHLSVAAGSGQRLAAWLLGLGWLLAVVALAGPSWQHEPPATYRTGMPLLVVVALDADMDRARNPERVETVQIRLHDLLGGWSGGPVGVIAFAGSSHVVTPLTDDARSIAQLTGRLEHALMPRPGALAAPALELAGDLLAGYGPVRGDVLLVADAIDDPAAAAAVAGRLRVSGHRVMVASLEGVALAGVADAGGGELLSLGGDGMLLAGSLGEEGWWRRPPPEADPDRQGEPVDGAIWLIPLLLPLVLWGFRRGLLLPMVATFALLPPPAEAGWWVRNDRAAAAALAAGATDVDPQALGDPAWQGVALYRAGRYAEAARAFRLAGDLSSRYNRANALAQLGQYAQAVAEYDTVLAERPDHVAARFNRAHVARLLDEQQAGAEGEGQGEAGQRRDRSDASPDTGEEGSPERPDQAGGAGSMPPSGEEPTPAELAEREAAEAAQQMRQWLSGVPDDPGGLLRERFAREWQRSREAVK